MVLNGINGNATLEEFLSTWPLEKITNMTIEQYANLDRHKGCFCWWLEYGSKDLGQIGGMPLTKFGLWKFKEQKEFTDAFRYDSTYAWSRKFGETRTEAFKRIINRVAEIAAAADSGDWAYLESIDFHSVAKWKIAFLYSHKQLVPIYTHSNLLQIARELGRKFAEDEKISVLQEFIRSKKPADKDVIDYAYELWQHYVNGKPFRNYFTVDVRHKTSAVDEGVDIFSQMLEKNVIAIGYMKDVDFAGLVDATEEEIQAYVRDNMKPSDPKFETLARTFQILMRLQPGDIIAFKKENQPGELIVLGYAVVTQVKGKCYEYRPDDLGHCIHVEFIEIGISRKFNFNYRGSIYAVKPEHLLSIFGPFMQVEHISISDDEEPSSDDEETIVSKPKPEESYVRGAIAARMVRQIHNIMQNDLYESLCKEFPEDKIYMEYKGRVDILRVSTKEQWLYEIKPFENIIACLREATGQLIEYSFRFQDHTRMTHLVVVGSGKPNADAATFISYFSDVVKLPLSYKQHLLPLRQKENPVSL